MNSMVSYAVSNRARIARQTTEWQIPVLESSLPDWYKFKLINSGYVIYTNMVLTKGGDVMVNEGAMGGFAGTMDQRLSSHPFTRNFSLNWIVRRWIFCRCNGSGRLYTSFHRTLLCRYGYRRWPCTNGKGLDVG